MDGTIRGHLHFNTLQYIQSDYRLDYFRHRLECLGSNRFRFVFCLVDYRRAQDVLEQDVELLVLLIRCWLEGLVVGHSPRYRYTPDALL